MTKDDLVEAVVGAAVGDAVTLLDPSSVSFVLTKKY